MLNFIYGALIMWFTLGTLFFFIREFEFWKDSILMPIAFLLYIIAFPVRIITESYKEIKSQL